MIGTLATQAVAAGFEVAIVTGDKDFFQLVHDGIKVYNPRDDGTWFDAGAVKEKFGVAPDQVVDVLALMGDSIDNIKGVPGIGEKGARDLIATYGTLEELLAHAGEVSNKRYREGLLTHADDARQSRELARIRTNVPVEFAAESAALSRRLARAVLRAVHAARLPDAGDGVRADRRDGRQGLRARRARSRTCGRSGRELRAAGRFALRVLPDAPSAMRAGIVGLSFSIRNRHARYVPLAVRTSSGDLFGAGPDEVERSAAGALAVEDALAELKAVLEDESIAKVGHDLKFDAIVLERHGVALRGIETDTMLASYLLDATRSSHPLEELALEHAGYKALREEDVCGRGAKAISFSQIPMETALDYAGERSDLALQVSATLRELLRKESLETLYQDLELPLIPVLVDIERAGVRDRRTDAAGAGAAHRRRARPPGRAGLRAVGRGIQHQLAEEAVGDPVRQAGAAGPRRSGARRRPRRSRRRSRCWRSWRQSHELPRLILEWRSLQKLKGTYIDALPQLVNPDTGRVHTCFNQAVAATGRLSSSDPNLQNIPIRTEVGREIRRAFVAEPGHVLISADYSQIELRVLAHLSGDEALIDAFQRGDDIHDRTALKVFGADSGLGAHELRRRAKIINYALLYGKTAFTLAKDIGVTAAGGAGVHRRVFRRLPVGARLHRRPARLRPRDRRREDDVRPAPAGAGSEQPERPDPRARRARRGRTCRSRAPPPTSSSGR